MGSPPALEYAIIGGGIAGLTLAIALHHRGLSVKVYEQVGQFGEIGAGVSFTPNALQAMRICHEGVYQAFERVSTHNIWPSKRKVWFDFYDGQNDSAAAQPNAPAFSISNEIGQNGVHRARFLDELIKLVPPEIAVFRKRLDRFEHDGKGRTTLFFEDGTTAKADAVLGCDGIKSRVRQLMFGTDHPCAYPTYTHKYAYRALIPMDEAVATIGEERAQNACMHMGQGGHVLTFPVNQGQTLNIVAFHTSNDEWPDHSKLTAPRKREDALRDFAGYGHTVTSLLHMVQPSLDSWAIFDLGQNPPPTYNQSRVCLVGDAGHATSPHHGAGAGFCIEDSAVLAELLWDARVTDSHGIELALASYDKSRRDRGAWLVQSSRRIGDTYEWMASGIGSDFAKIEDEINTRNGIIADVDVAAMCHAAHVDLESRYREDSKAQARM